MSENEIFKKTLDVGNSKFYTEVTVTWDNNDSTAEYNKKVLKKYFLAGITYNYLW